MKKLLLSTGLLASLLMLCSGTKCDIRSILLEENMQYPLPDDNRAFFLETGDQLKLLIPENPTTGITSQAPVLSDKDAFTLVRNVYLAPPRRQAMIGEGGYRLFIFKAVRPTEQQETIKIKQGPDTYTVTVGVVAKPHGATETGKPSNFVMPPDTDSGTGRWEPGGTPKDAVYFLEVGPSDLVIQEKDQSSGKAEGQQKPKVVRVQVGTGIKIDLKDNNAIAYKANYPTRFFRNVPPPPPTSGEIKKPAEPIKLLATESTKEDEIEITIRPIYTDWVSNPPAARVIHAIITPAAEE